MSTVSDTASRAPRRNRQKDLRRAALHAFLIGMSILWLLPLLLAVYASFRLREDTDAAGYLSLPAGGLAGLTVDNYVNAWNQSEMARYLLNTAVIVVPTVIIVLLLASMMAFVVSRYSWRFNLFFLLTFTAANLLPPQVIITPLFRLFLLLPLPEDLFGIAGLPSDRGVFYDTYVGIIAINVAFQLGFVTFVMSNYMKTIPKELNEAAIVDGAGVWTTFSRVIMPLTRPALAALAVLQFTWIYNDFFWAIVLIRTGSKMPITSALNLLKGTFFTDYNLLAAGSLLVMLPTLIVFFVLQKQFISGLTLGSTKG